MITNNACPPRITAAAGTELAGTSFSSQVIIYLDERALQRIYLCLHHSRNIAGSSFRSLSNIPHCCLRKETGPYLSSSVAVYSLKPTKDHWFGELLPHQQSNPKQANFVAITILGREVLGHLGKVTTKSMWITWCGAQCAVRCAINAWRGALCAMLVRQRKSVNKPDEEDRLQSIFLSITHPFATLPKKR